MKKALLFALSILSLSSCDKEEVIIIKEVEKEFSWKSRPGFEYEYATQLNSFAADEHLFTLGINTMTAVLPDSVKDRYGANWTHYSLFNQLPISYKFPIHADYFISFSEKEPAKLKLSPTLNPSTYTASRPAALTIPFPKLDSTFHRFGFVHFSDGESFAINSKGQALVTYQSSREGSPLRLRAMLLDVAATPLEVTTSVMDTLRTRKLDFNSTYDGFLAFMQSVDDHFFVSPNYEETYRVSPDGKVEKVLSDRLHAIFEAEQVLYAIGSGGTGYVSTDAGRTWLKNFEFPLDWTWLSYTKVDGKVIAYKNSRIFEIIPSLARVEYKELDNDGLVGKGITSISEFKNKVYVTTFSGVFYKEADNFFVKREEEL